MYDITHFNFNIKEVNIKFYGYLKVRSKVSLFKNLIMLKQI